MLIGALLALIALAPSALAPLREVITIGWVGDEVGERLGVLVAFYFGSGGFLVGYLTARRRAFELNRPQLLEDGLQLALMLPPDASRWKGLTLEQNRAIEAVARAPRDRLRTIPELRAWARVNLVMGDEKGAFLALERLAQGSTDTSLREEFELAKRKLEARTNAAEARANEVQALPPPVEISAPPASEAAPAPASVSPVEPPPASEAAPTRASASPVEAMNLLPTEAISRIYQALYEPPPDGFRKAIELGERFSDKVQSAELWAYLACAYGQHHAYLKSSDTRDPRLEDEIANRALFCVQQAIDVDATWRALLRSFWNPSSPSGDNDLVSLHADPRFASILDSESAAAKTLIAGRRAGASCRYQGSVASWVTQKDGTEVQQDHEGSYVANKGAELRLVAQFFPSTASPQKTHHAIQLDGSERAVVDFTLRPDAADIEVFTPNTLTIAVPTNEASPQPDFSFTAPEERGSYELWLYVSQAGRTAQLVKTKIVIT
jgi:hypothetical protein